MPIKFHHEHKLSILQQQLYDKLTNRCRILGHISFAKDFVNFVNMSVLEYYEFLEHYRFYHCDHGVKIAKYHH